MADLRAAIREGETALARQGWRDGMSTALNALRTLLAAARETEAALAEVETALGNASCPAMGEGVRRETLAERIERLAGLLGAAVRDEDAALAALAEERRRSQRLRDLVVTQRAALHDQGLISDEEYAALAEGSSEAARRLEGYVPPQPAPMPAPEPDARRLRRGVVPMPDRDNPLKQSDDPFGLTPDELAEILREEAGSLMAENRALILRYKELVSAIRRHRESRLGDGNPVLISDRALWRVIGTA